MQVFHTAGVPPSSGSTMRPNIGCTRNSRNALVKMAAVNTASTARPRPVDTPGWAVAAGMARAGVCWVKGALAGAEGFLRG